jgi:GT2 family glycosyltransferase
VAPHLRETPPLDAVYGDVWMMESDSRYFGEFQPQDFFRYNVCQQALFYRRDLVLEMGGFDTRYPVLSDYEFNVRLFSRPGARIRYLPLIVANYPRQRIEFPQVARRSLDGRARGKVGEAFGIRKTKGKKKRAEVR